MNYEEYQKKHNIDTSKPDKEFEDFEKANSTQSLLEGLRKEFYKFIRHPKSSLEVADWWLLKIQQRDKELVEKMAALKEIYPCIEVQESLNELKNFIQSSH